MSDAFLQIQNLRTHFPVERGVLFRRRIGTVKAVDGVSLSLANGEILGLVGESGSGKSTLGRTILQLIRPTEGAVILGGKSLTQLESSQLRDARVDFRSQPKVFLGITPNSEMLGVFWMREPRTLYGRQTEMLYRGRHIGDIVEVLPPV